MQFHIQSYKKKEANIAWEPQPDTNENDNYSTAFCSIPQMHAIKTQIR